MSAEEERPPLASRPSHPSLYAYARARLDAEPEGRLPTDPYPPPDDAGAPRGTAPLRHSDGVAAVQEALGPLLGPPGSDPGATAEAVRHRLAELPVRGRTVTYAVDHMHLTDEPAARALGRHLVRTAPDLASAHVGLALLDRLGEAADVPYLRVLGLVHGLTRPAVRALQPLDPRAAALLHLICHTERPCLRVLADAFASGNRRAATTALIEDPVGIDTVSPAQARLLAEAADLAGLLRGGRIDPRLLVQAGRLLVRMAGERDHDTQILLYGDAVEVCETVVRRVGELPPTAARAAVLVPLARALDNGPCSLLPWREGQREQLLDALGALLASPDRAVFQRREAPI
ncbi:hypothetical protein [Streptomyces sp. NPDC094032]|uniref:hypothetical protein n=1 Tax=Streptomyces sp. NPDC094032 TaxID=3155308 RepID=UPI0033217FB9